MNLITRFFLVLTALLLTCAAPTLSRAEEKPTTAPSSGSNGQKTPQAGSLISANGFICSMLEGQAQCHGAFKEVDKDLEIGAKGGGSILLQVKKDNKLFTYASQNGCLCTQKKDEISCQNAQGKKNNFKGDKMKDESSSFCSGKK